MKQQRELVPCVARWSARWSARQVARRLATAVLACCAPGLLAQSPDSHTGHGDPGPVGPAYDIPAGARDPHAYAGGLTLESGPHIPSGVKPLHMGDEHASGSLLVDRLEWVGADGSEFGAYDARAWFGHAYRRLVLKAEGDYDDGELDSSTTELLYSRALASFWDLQGGLRYDTGTGPDRGWLAFGVEGLAPYWFEVDATAYLGEGGRTGLKLAVEYELLLTQRLILQPRLELEGYGQDDRKTATGQGLSSGTAGLRLRYEITRQLAPYAGIEWARSFGNTADYAHEEGGVTSELRVVAGIRIWI